jgi:hypothetical protein
VSDTQARQDEAKLQDRIAALLPSPRPYSATVQAYAGEAVIVDGPALDALAAELERVTAALREIEDPSYVGNYSPEKVVSIYRMWAHNALRTDLGGDPVEVHPVLVADRSEVDCTCGPTEYCSSDDCKGGPADRRDDTQQAREAEIYADLLGEAEAIYGRPADASLRAVLRRIAEKEAAR